MGRKRKAAPCKADEAKRQLMTWNMYDQTADLTIIGDADPSLTNEQLQSQLQTTTRKITETESAEIGQQMIKDLIDDCHFYIPLHRQKTVKEKQWCCELGNFHIFTEGAEIPQAVTLFRLYINRENGQRLLYYETECELAAATSSSNAAEHKQKNCIRVKSDLPALCFEGLNLASFRLYLKGCSDKTNTLKVAVYILESGLTNLDFGSECCAQRKVHATIRQLVRHFYGIKAPG